MAKSRSADRNVPPPLPEPLDGSVFDAHCHLDSMAQRLGLTRRGEPAPMSFIDQAVTQARTVGVTQMINVGCAVGEWESTIASLENPYVFGALAVHPTEVAGLTDADYDELERLLKHPKVVAVGETGLDYYWDNVSAAEQQEHFRRQIELAKRVAKPLMIHDRDAHADVLAILAHEGAPPAGVIFHAFSGNAAMAAECAEAGYLMSFPGVLTFANAPELRAAARVAPLEQILVETDAPFLTAHPYRGRPNAPYLVPHVVRLLAELKNVPESVVCATISATGRRSFGIN
ncbi:MAG: TatD family deoxyribonuclease [Frankiales bacterium]|nr:TatD family deoxyribonuclease [Frankiales bacterium]